MVIEQCAFPAQYLQDYPLEKPSLGNTRVLTESVV